MKTGQLVPGPRASSAARDWLGSSWNFENVTARTFHYEQLGNDFVLGLRADFQLATDGTPFIAPPYSNLRGIPAPRYQDQKTAVVETELRWNITPRWAILGFIGTGRAYGSHTDFGDSAAIWSRGTGFRYLIARKLGLYAGIDGARGPEVPAQMRKSLPVLRQ